MKQTTLDNVKNFFSQYGWKYKALDSYQLISGWKNGPLDYALYVKTYSSFIKFHVPILQLLSTDNLLQSQLLKKIIQINNDIHLVRVHLEHQTISIQAEALVKDFGYQQFNIFVGMIGYYAETLHLELNEYLELINQTDFLH